MKKAVSTFVAAVIFSASVHGQTVTPDQRAHQGSISAPHGMAQPNTASPYLSQTQQMVRTGQNSYAAVKQYVFNDDPTFAPHLRACLANVKYGEAIGSAQGNCKIGWLGDSTGIGYQSNFPSGGSDTKTGAFPARVAQALTLRGYNTEFDNFFGDGGGGGGASQTDPTIAITSYGTNCTSAAGVEVAGGNLIQLTNGCMVSMKPRKPSNTVSLCYGTQNAFGSQTFNVNVDGGTNTLINATAALGVVCVPVTASTVGYHTYNMINVSGSNYFAGYDAYNSTISQIRSVNISEGGAATPDILNAANPTLGYFPTITAFGGFDAVFVDLTINNSNMFNIITTGTSTNGASYRSDLQTIINKLRASGTTDVIFITGNPTQVGLYPLAPWHLTNQFIQEFYQVAAANNIPVIDNFSRAGFVNQSKAGWEIQSGVGMEYTDGLHQNGPGYIEYSASIENYILSLAGDGYVSTSTQAVTAAGACSPTAVSGTAFQPLGAVGGFGAGAATSGTTGGCVITFTLPPVKNTWTCYGNDITTPADKFSQTSSTQTSCTLTGSSTSGDVVSAGFNGY